MFDRVLNTQLYLLFIVIYFLFIYILYLRLGKLKTLIRLIQMQYEIF